MEKEEQKKCCHCGRNSSQDYLRYYSYIGRISVFNYYCDSCMEILGDEDKIKGKIIKN